MPWWILSLNSCHARLVSSITDATQIAPRLMRHSTPCTTAISPYHHFRGQVSTIPKKNEKIAKKESQATNMRLLGSLRASDLQRRVQNMTPFQWTISLLLSARMLGCCAFSSDLSYPKCRLQTRCFASISDISTERLVQIGRASFQSHFNYQLDDWQSQAGGAIIEGSNLIVCAPTGAGKVSQ
jgi:superfamily II RNA helicase